MPPVAVMLPWRMQLRVRQRPIRGGTSPRVFGISASRCVPALGETSTGARLPSALIIALSAHRMRTARDLAAPEMDR